MEEAQWTGTSARCGAGKHGTRQRVTRLVTFALAPDDFSTLTRYAAHCELKPHRVLRRWVEARLDSIRRDLPFVDGQPQ